MWQAKIIIVGLLLMTIGNAYAWDEESGYAEGEYVNVVFEEGGEYTANNDPEINLYWIEDALLLVHRIFCFFIGDHSSNQIKIDYSAERETWNPTTEEYENDPDDNFKYSSSKNVSWSPNVTTEQTFTENPIVEMVKQGIKDGGTVDDIKTTNDDPNHPDVFNTTVTISGGGVDMTESGYVAITDNGLDGIAGEISNPDYGFDMEGRGSGGGSGGIYEGINMYGSAGGDTTGMGASFYTIFWCIIPLVFVLSVMKLASRCMK